MKKLIFGLIISSAAALSVNAESKVKNFNHNERHSYNYSVHKNNHQSHDRRVISSTRHKNHHPHERRHHDHHSSHSSHSRSGYYDYVTNKVWIPQRCHKTWIPPRYEYRRQPCGNFVKVLVCEGRYTTRIIPGYYDYQTVKVWRPRSKCNSRKTVSIHWGW